MEIAPLRARGILLAACAASIVCLGSFASTACAQSRHVRVAGRLVPENASVAPRETTGHSTQPARRTADVVHRDPPAQSPADAITHPESRDLSAPSEPPATEREEEKEEEAVANDEPADETLDGLLGPFLVREHGGVTGEYIYTGEVFMNARGGIATAHSPHYRGNLDLVVQIDTAKQQFWDGGRFFIYGQSTHGKSISEDYVGDYQLLSNLDPWPKTEIAQVSEYWYRQDFGDGNLGFKAGKQDANADFAFADLGGDFINSSFGQIPTVPLPTFPNPGLGLACFCHLHEHALISGGIYDGLPDGGQWGFSGLGDNGCISLTQLELRQPEEFGNGLPGTVRLGFWYHSGNPEEIVADPHPRLLGDNYGAWATFDKMLINETGEDGDEQGLGAFAQFGWAPQDRNQVDQHYAGGILYRGPIDGRDLDVVGLGVTNVLYGTPSRRIFGTTYETATEVFYKAFLTDFIALQFDLQYITNPEGVYPDSIAPGVRFEVVL
ncbi:carbohydrate porin [Lacipirellula sp.]|uniref:carbohydrate porin n=1 Tax=Lacipirellula sp. TaxID=2691419 RepID=UPI003D0EBEFA